METICILYISVHIFCACSYVSSVYFYIVIKIYCFIINASIHFFLCKYILNIPFRDYSYLLPYRALTFYSKVCIRYKKEKQEQCNFILLCFQFNSCEVDVNWLESRSWENSFWMTLYSVCYIGAGQDGKAGGGRWCGRRKIFEGSR